jgi:hypothetical protein
VTVEDNGKKVDSIDSISAKGALVASRRVLDRRGEFRASAALEIFAVKKGDGKAARTDAETETRVEPESDGGVRSEAWSSTVAIAIASAPPESSTREALEAMTSFPSASPSSRRDANETKTRGFSKTKRLSRRRDASPLWRRFASRRLGARASPRRS